MRILALSGRGRMIPHHALQSWKEIVEIVVRAIVLSSDVRTKTRESWACATSSF